MLIGLLGLFAPVSLPIRSASVPVAPFHFKTKKMKTPRVGKSADMRPLALRCEYLPDPLGVETLQPRLYWTLDSKRRGEMQTAYRILAASSPDALKADQGDLWDSGKVASDASTHIEYAGKPLHSGERVWWKVKVWDVEGRESAYTAPAFWEMGLLAPEDWKAQWIGLPDTPAEKAADIWKDAQWIWYPEGDPIQSAPAGDRYFWHNLQLPQKPVRKAELIGIADNSFTVTVNGKDLGGGSGWQRLTTLDIASILSSGANLLVIKANNTDGPAGFACVVRITFVDGTEQRLVTNGEWYAQTPDENTAFVTAAARAKTVPPGGTMARSLGPIGIAPWGRPGAQAPARPAPYLRKTFAVSKAVKSARVYATAQGLYTLTLNGKPVSHDVFRPGWTDYNKRIQYQTYDVTRLVQNGSNALGVVLGDGWFCGHVGLTGGNNYGTKPRALVQMQIAYTDGTSQNIVSDGSWAATTGPVLSDDLLDGETYDARKELTGWNTPDYNDSDWQKAAVLGQEKPKPTSPLLPVPPAPQLVSQFDQSVQVVEELKPRTVTEKPNGAYVFDLGQNMVGWARLKARAEAGTTIRMRFAEMLNPDGTIYTTNLRGAKCTDYYTCKGNGVETWEPSFTFHGFRYVELTGLKSKPSLDAVTGVVITSAAPQTGTFTCSSPLVNQLQHNIVWGQHGNYLEVPTDCPQRDERLGWMGDAQIFVRTACFNNDIAAFMTKWTQDVVDAQSPAGGFSDVTPRVGDPADGAPAWGDAGVIVPWTIYQCYGDTRLIAERYPAMQKWIEYVRSVNPDLVWRKRANNNFGDWLNTGSDTPREVLSTAYFAYSARLLSKMALAIGKTDEARQYEDLFQQIKAAFNQEFVAPDGRIKGDTQTAYVLALRFDLLPPEKRETAAKYLVDDILNKRGGHLSTGFLGVGYLTPTLTQTGYLDVAYRLLNNDTYPSWGYSIRHGATTIWERWDGWTEEKGFQDPGMNSFNHYSLGSVGEWMYASVAGIDLDPAQPGYKHILLHPHPGGGLTYARAAYDSIHGRIVSDWKLENGRLAYRVEVPANTTATVWVPASGETPVMEGGKPADKADGVKFLRREAGYAVYEIGSGAYAFTAPIPR